MVVSRCKRACLRLLVCEVFRVKDDDCRGRGRRVVDDDGDDDEG